MHRLITRRSRSHGSIEKAVAAVVVINHIAALFTDSNLLGGGIKGGKDHREARFFFSRAPRSSCLIVRDRITFDHKQ